MNVIFAKSTSGRLRYGVESYLVCYSSSVRLDYLNTKASARVSPVLFI